MYSAVYKGLYYPRYAGESRQTNIFLDHRILNRIWSILEDQEDGIYILMDTVQPLACRNRIEFLANYVCSRPQVKYWGQADNESQNSAHFWAQEWYSTIQHTALWWK